MYFARRVGFAIDQFFLRDQPESGTHDSLPPGILPGPAVGWPFHGLGADFLSCRHAQELRSFPRMLWFN